MARTTIRTEDITASAVTSAKIAAGAVDTSGLEDDVALLGFKVASNGSLAKYNLVDQTVDDFQDTSGVDASASTNEVRDGTGKYYSGETAAAGDATGGTITYSSGNTIHSFTANGNFVVPSSGTIGTYLVIGAGGGGGSKQNACGGGGGAGAYRTATSFAVTEQTYAITVGAGGAGGDGTVKGAVGVNSIFSTITSDGGAGGSYGAINPDAYTGNGSGSAGGYGTTGTSGGTYGNDGGDGAPAGYSPYYGGGAGGGAGGAGANGTTTTGGAGGAGTSSSITGSAITRAGGGGGGVVYGGTPGAGGSGGGGAGGGPTSDGVNGTANLGGGGGGSGNSSAGLGGTGGSGVVILSYTTDSFTVDTPANLTLISTTTAAQAAPTKGDVVFTYTNGAGSTTLGTDVTAEISADGGSTWTAMTLGQEELPHRHRWHHRRRHSE